VQIEYHGHSHFCSLAHQTHKTATQKKKKKKVVSVKDLASPVLLRNAKILDEPQ
jgi:hypothetical protein